LNFLWKEESIKEAFAKIKSKSYYITPDGKIAFSASNDVNEIFLRNMTE